MEAYGELQAAAGPVKQRYYDAIMGTIPQEKFNGYCQTFTGPVGPITIAKFTLQNDVTNFYDVTIIGGANLPMHGYA